MNNNNTSHGIGFCGLLTIAFIVLKLCKVINWAWVWVIAPMWITIAISLLMYIIIIITALIMDKFST